ncbi:MAG: DUF4417 domain-containing protein [Planctomycetes bacterium]|nr:DUF4417 domain-containing protein [Planctomycetota bacterium]
MSNDEQLRVAARPHGIVAQGCQNCAHLPTCGGIEPLGSLFDCFEHYCCGGKADCDDVCPYNADFIRRMTEIGGLRFGQVSSLEQGHVELPRYVPLIHHGYSHRKPLDLPVVALETYQVLRLKDKKYEAIAGDGAQLRQEFGLSPSTQIILRGTAKDRPLEQYWSYRRRDRVPEQIGALGVLLAIAPNFSHFLDVPRTDNLFNRKRQLICIAEMQKAGVIAVPHLSAVTPGDWRFWQRYLQRNETVVFVAAEFQTGNKNPAQGRKVIESISVLQDAVGRRLHPIIIGGTQFATEVAGRFDMFTLIDSCPFIKAVKRRKFDKGANGQPWAETYTLNGQGIEDIVLRNLDGHTAWIEEQCSQVSSRKEVVPML